MSETATLETPAQAVVEPTPVTAPAAVEAVTPTPAPAGETVTKAQALEAIFEARTTGNNKEADRITALLEAADKAPAIAEPVAAVEPVAEVEPSEIDPDPDPEPAVIEPAAGTVPVEKPDPNRLRITHLSESDKSDQIAIHALTKKGVPLAEAMQRILGPLPTAQAPVAEVPVVAEPVAQSQSVSEMEAEVAEIERQMDELAESSGLYGPDAARLNKAFGRASAKLEAAKIEAAFSERENARESGAFETQRSANEAATIKQYPTLSDPNSTHSQLWYELSVAAHNPSHPDHLKAQAVDGPAFFAAKAAKMLGAQPAKVAPVVPAPPAAQPPPATRPAAATKGSAPPPPAKTSADIAREREAEFEAASTGNFSANRRPIGGIITR